MIGSIVFTRYDRATGRSGWPSVYHTREDCRHLRSAEARSDGGHPETHTREMPRKTAECAGFRKCTACG